MGAGKGTFAPGANYLEVSQEIVVIVPQTVEYRTGTAIVPFTWDAPVTTNRVINAASSGYTLVSVEGLNFGHEDPTSTVAISDSTALCLTGTAA